jgi:hypothetical protein
MPDLPVADELKFSDDLFCAETGELPFPTDR